MAMLAGPRRKQKFSIDPTGSSWSKDDSKFGQKLLEKMGWSKGRGLGANEDGRVEHVKITHKDDTRGVGCSKSHADNWIAHQDDFNSLLANLNQNYTSDEDKPAVKVDKILCLEEKSKASKGRVHYQKFTKGKDLSSRKLEDLDCIFGRRQKKKTSKEDRTREADNDSTQDEDNRSGGQTFDSTDSVQSYFARKLAKKNSPKIMELTNTMEEETSSFSNELEEKKDVTQPTTEYGVQTFSSSQSVTDYFAQKMAMLRSGKNTLDAKEDCDNKMERESDTAFLSVSNNLVDADVQEDYPSKRPKKKKQKKRKHELGEVQSDGKKDKVDGECGELPVKKKKKHKTTDDTEKEIQPDLFLAETDKADETKTRKKRKKKRDHVTDSSVNESYIEVTNETKELSACTINKPDVDTPSRKQVHFRDPIITIVKENTNPQKNNCESGTVVVTKSEVSESKVVSAESGTANENILHTNNEQCGSVVEKTVRSNKKKKAKKKDKQKKLEETLGNACCEMKNDDVSKSAVCSSHESSIVETLDPEKNNTPSQKEKRKQKKKEQEIYLHITETLNELDSTKAVTDIDRNIDTNVDKFVKGKRNRSRRNRGKQKYKLYVKPKFVGSNIDKIPGYSSSKMLLKAL